MKFNPNKIVTTHAYTHTSEVIRHGKFGSDFMKEISQASSRVQKKYGILVEYVGGSYSGCSFRFTTNQNPNMLEAAVTYFDNCLAKQIEELK